MELENDPLLHNHNISLLAPDGLFPANPLRIERDLMMVPASFEFLRRYLWAAHHNKKQHGALADWPRSANDTRLVQIAAGDPLFDEIQQSLRSEVHPELNVTLILLRPSALLSFDESSPTPQAQLTPFSAVLFTSMVKKTIKPPVNDAIGHLDGTVLDVVRANKSIHGYVVFQQPDKENWVDLVLGRPLQPGEPPSALMDNSCEHANVTRNVAPRYYTFAAIHSGKAEVRFGESQGEGYVRFGRTLFCYYTSDDPTASDVPEGQQAHEAAPGWPRVCPVARHVIMRDNCIAAFDGAVGTGNVFARLCDIEAGESIQKDGRLVRTPLSKGLSLAVGVPSSHRLRCTAFLGRGLEPFYRDVVDYLASHLQRTANIQLEWIDPEKCIDPKLGPFQSLVADPLQSADPKADMVDHACDLMFLCGAQFAVNYFDPAMPRNALLTNVLCAPVLALDEGGPPHYHSVLVQSSQASLDTSTIASLKNLRFAANEPQSWSGYLVMRHAVLRAHEEKQIESEMASLDGLFSEVVWTGSHRESLGAVAAGKADVACIDRTVWESERHQNPLVVMSPQQPQGFGSDAPWPMPPLVANRKAVLPQLQHCIAEALLHMDKAAPLFKRSALSGFAAANNVNYKRLYEAVSQLL